MVDVVVENDLGGGDENDSGGRRNGHGGGEENDFLKKINLVLVPVLEKPILNLLTAFF